jgi:hypothetical protein
MLIVQADNVKLIQGTDNRMYQRMGTTIYKIKEANYDEYSYTPSKQGSFSEKTTTVTHPIDRHAVVIQSGSSWKRGCDIQLRRIF